jgi:transposase
MTAKTELSAPKRRTRAEVQQLVAEFVSSGMLRTEFCRSRGSSFSTLDRHLKKRRWRRRRKPISTAGRLVPVELAARKSPKQHEPSCGLAVVLPGGRRIEVHPDFDTNTFEHLVRILERAYALFGLGPATRIYLAAGVTDMRKGFEGLYGLVRDRLSCEPLSGHLFLFSNGQRNRLKVLVWDGSGLWVCAKRLEKGRFNWPQFGDAHGKVILSHEELSLLLGGIDLSKTKHKPWCRKASPEGHAAV